MTDLGSKITMEIDETQAQSIDDFMALAHMYDPTSPNGERRREILSGRSTEMDGLSAFVWRTASRVDQTAYVIPKLRQGWKKAAYEAKEKMTIQEVNEEEDHSSKPPVDDEKAPMSLEAAQVESVAIGKASAVEEATLEELRKHANDIHFARTGQTFQQHAVELRSREQESLQAIQGSSIFDTATRAPTPDSTEAEATELKQYFSPNEYGSSSSTGTERGFDDDEDEKARRGGDDWSDRESFSPFPRGALLSSTTADEKTDSETPEAAGRPEESSQSHFHCVYNERTCKYQRPDGSICFSCKRLGSASDS